MSLPGQKFLNDECREIVETASVVEEPPILADVDVQTVWEVWSWYANGRRWSRHRGFWFYRENAVSCARERAKMPGHVKVRIVRIDLQ